MSVPRVYLLGKNPLTGVISHCISKLPNQPQIPEIVSLLPSEEHLRTFLNNNSTTHFTQYQSPDRFLTTTTQLMSACRPPMFNDGTYAPINELVVSLSTYNDVKGLLTYKNCMSPDTNILLLNSDRWILNTISEKIWRNPLQRPNLYQCLSDFTVWNKEPFHTAMLGQGSLKISKIPRYFHDYDEYLYKLSDSVKGSGGLIEMITETNILNPIFMTYEDFALEQAELMIVKASIGSLTTLYDCSNGELLRMGNISNVLLNLIKELRLIILNSDSLLSKKSKITYTNLSSQRLLGVILQVLSNSERSSSIMRTQFRISSDSEIKNTLTYFTREALKNKVHAPNTLFLRNLLISKLSTRDLSLKAIDIDDPNDIELEL